MTNENEIDVADATDNTSESVNTDNVNTNVVDNSAHNAYVSTTGSTGDSSNYSSTAGLCLDTNNAQNTEVTELTDAHVEAPVSTAVVDVVLEGNSADSLS